MFSFFRKKKKDTPTELPVETNDHASNLETPDLSEPESALEQEETRQDGELVVTENRLQAEIAPTEPNPALDDILEAEDFQNPPDTPNAPAPQTQEKPRLGWMQRLSTGLKRTGKSLTEVFTGTQIDDDLYEELEAALLMADAGTAATQYLLDDVKQRVKATKTTEPTAVRHLLAQALEDLLRPLEAPLIIGEHMPTVIMVAGVNGAGKTTSIGKLTRHLANSQHKVLLAAGDTFRAAAREQLEVWADRNQVEIIAQQGGDPASVSFDAVSSGKAKQVDVVMVDTAGRLATQPHLMEELKKIRRVITKAMEGAPHEVLLVVDGNTGQNALAQVQAFDEAIQLTGLVVTKLDGTAKGGVMAAIALWSQKRGQTGKSPVPIYFIGVGEQVEDLQTFNAKEFAQALLH